MSDSAKTKEMFSLYKQRVVLALDELIEGADKKEEIKQIEDEMLLKSEPLIFTGPNSFEIKLDKQFNELSIFIAKQTTMNVKTMTVFEFYNALEYIEKTGKYETNIL